MRSQKNTFVEATLALILIFGTVICESDLKNLEILCPKKICGLTKVKPQKLGSKLLFAASLR
jgi:hypothetical protein